MLRRSLIAAVGVSRSAGAVAQPFAGVVFPPGSSMGLRPPPGMVVSPRFSGFAEPGLPAATHPLHAATLRFDENPLEPASDNLAGAAAIVADHGVDLTGSRIVPHPDGFATLHHGTYTHTTNVRGRVQALVLPQRSFMGLAWFNAPPRPGAAYPADIVDAALLSVRIRPKPSLADQLAALSFTMTDLAGFSIHEANGSGGFSRSATLTDGDMHSDVRAIVSVTRQHYQPIPVPPGITAGEALRAVVGSARRMPPRFDEPLGADGWWFDELHEQPDTLIGGLAWTISLFRHATNGYLHISALADPRDRATLLPRLRRLHSGMAAR